MAAFPDPVRLSDDDMPPARLVVLAGHGPGASRVGGDALAARFGQSHRCMIPLAGSPLIAHVLHTAAQHPRVASLAICVEREAFDGVWDVLTRTPGRGSVALVEAGTDIPASVRMVAEGWEGPLLVTTADHALLSPASIDAALDALDESDVVFAVARAEDVLAVHPLAERGIIALRDGAYVPCDLYGMGSSRFVDAVDIFRGRTGDTVREASRMLRALGLLGLLSVKFGIGTLQGVEARASRHLRRRVRAVVLEDGAQAIDVDNDRSYAIVRDLVEKRGGVDFEADLLGGSRSAVA